MSQKVSFTRKTRSSVINYTKREFIFPAMSTQENIENLGICLEGVTGLKLTSIISDAPDIMDFVVSFLSGFDGAKELIGISAPYCIEVYDHKVYKVFTRKGGEFSVITIEVVPLSSADAVYA